MKINDSRPMKMHIDLNSCFATIEQQSRPLLRNRPVAVVNRRTEHTAVITASYEAKRQGIGVGMKLTTARLLCPNLVAVETDPPKYKYVYHKLLNILNSYSPSVHMKSIDEGIIDFAESPAEYQQQKLSAVAREIKNRLREEIGEYMSCNIGIGTNQFLAKMAAGLNKPDGLTEINHLNLRKVYSSLKLEDLTGIASGYGKRLRKLGINSPLDFLDANELTLEKQIFNGKCGRDWYRRLRGWEVDVLFHELQSVGRQFVLEEFNLSHGEVLRRFHGLCEDVAAKLRSQGVWARTVKIYVRSPSRSYWHATIRSEKSFNDEATIFTLVKKLFHQAPLPALEIGVTCSSLTTEADRQIDLFNDEQGAKITRAIDEINGFWGDHAIHSADTLGLSGRMQRKIPFGSTRYL